MEVEHIEEHLITELPEPLEMCHHSDFDHLEAPVRPTPRRGEIVILNTPRVERDIWREVYVPADPTEMNRLAHNVETAIKLGVKWPL